MKSDIPKKYRATYDRAMSGKSRKAAVRAYCLSCMDWRESEVRLCPTKTCPLHRYRILSAPSQAQKNCARATQTTQEANDTPQINLADSSNAQAGDGPESRVAR